MKVDVHEHGILSPNPSVLYVPWYFTLGSFENVLTSRIIVLGPTNHPGGSLQQFVKEKVTDYRQNLTLFCPVGNCCSEPPGWFVGPKTIILDVRTFSNDPKVKYHGTLT
jgi:hypothetical protein